tara:strand:+ start:12126 stop:12845 length:720 start_codon:yes stop_codon:yes gene_type:complete
MSDLIDYHGIKISLSGKLILDIDHLAVKAHQCTLVTGQNGSGKTTLFKIMSGLLRPDSIQVDYQGRQMNWKQAKPVLQRDIIYLHQQPYLFDASVADNVAYGLYRRGESKNSVQKKVFQALDWANLSHLAQRHAKHLSGGEKQRVALTRARILAPSLLLLDEPTASMDNEAKQQTAYLLQRLKEEGVCVVISSHESHTVDHLADHHLCIEHGKITALEPVKQSAKVTVLNHVKNTLSHD